jgi:hypothetical protein
MGNYGDDRDGGGDRWRDRDQGHDRGYRAGGDRGFVDRAGDEVRSWFGGDDAQRRREADQRRWEQEQRMSGRRDNDSGPGTFGGGGFGTGWGNQEGRSWNRERPGERGGSGAYGGSGDDECGGNRHYARGEREGWFTDSEGGERGRRFGGQGGGQDPGGLHDPHYSEWRRRQIEDLDRDYEEYRREHQSKFEAEFGRWREKRQGQRQSLGRVTEHMEVVGSDGGHVGTVDKVRGDRIILAKSDPASGGVHHSVPCSWVERVEEKVMLNKSADEASSEWRSEERSRALFEREGEGGGPRNLDRAFSGTYEGREGERGEREE